MTTISLTAGEWNLFDMRGAAAAAKRLSAAMTEAMQMVDRPAAEAHMRDAMKKDERFGAMDTEPQAIARAFLDRRFPDTEAGFGRIMCGYGAAAVVVTDELHRALDGVVPIETVDAYTPDTLLPEDIGLRNIPGAGGAARDISAALTEALDMGCRALAEIHILAALHKHTAFGALSDATKAALRAFLDIRWPLQRSGLGMTAPLPTAATVDPVTLAETAAPAEVISIKAAKTRRRKTRTATPAPAAAVGSDDDFYAYI